MGAMMLFSEKYNDVVRMIQFDKSKELCGGTHVNATGEIGMFKILSEGSIASGIRRIEAITAMGTLSYFNQIEDTLKDISHLVKSNDLQSGILQLINSNKELEKKLASLKGKNSESEAKNLLDSSTNINGINLISKVVDMDSNEMKSLSFKFRKEKNLIMVLASKENKKALLTVLVTDDLVERGVDASTFVKEIAKEIDGGGGGQKFFATAGGSRIDGLDKALEKAKEIVIKQKSQ
jgi:alanyl-tRNA synthetase